jgi:hypothetical protein
VPKCGRAPNSPAGGSGRGGGAVLVLVTVLGTKLISAFFESWTWDTGAMIWSPPAFEGKQWNRPFVGMMMIALGRRYRIPGRRPQPVPFFGGLQSEERDCVNERSFTSAKSTKPLMAVLILGTTAHNPSTGTTCRLLHYAVRSRCHETTGNPFGRTVCSVFSAVGVGCAQSVNAVGAGAMGRYRRARLLEGPKKSGANSYCFRCSSSCLGPL